MFFPYGETETAYLAARDKRLAAAMAQIGQIERAVNPDLFAALINAIIGQQISTKAQATIWARFQTAFAPLTATRIAALSAEDIQRCGVSMRKAGYIKSIAETVASGTLDLSALQGLPDGEVCTQLSALNGIGVWTAEMLMLFSMQRQDILSYGDLAIRRGLRMLYRHKAITPTLFTKYKRRYAPYASVASLYLWAIAGGACGLSDPAAGNALKGKGKA